MMGFVRVVRCGRSVFACLLVIVGCGPKLGDAPTTGGGAGSSSTGSESSTDGEASASSAASDSSTVDDGGTGVDINCALARDEALPVLDAIVAGATEYFEAEHPFRDLPGFPLHHCPTVGETFAASGSATPTPTLGISCWTGHGARTYCLGYANGTGCDNDFFTCYALELWTKHKIWQALGVVVDTPHSLHYDFEYSNDTEGFGRCRFTATGYGDLDVDLNYSTYARSGELSEQGLVLDDLIVSQGCE